jgi:hypothetical protein
VYAIVARPTSGTTYEVIYRQEFDTYTGGDVKEVAIDTCSVSVQSGDVVGYYISNGAVIWRNSTASSWRGGHYTFNTAVGGTFNMASYNESTTTTVGIKYTLMSA